MGSEAGPLLSSPEEIDSLREWLALPEWALASMPASSTRRSAGSCSAKRALEKVSCSTRRRSRGAMGQLLSVCGALSGSLSGSSAISTSRSERLTLPNRNLHGRSSGRWIWTWAWPALRRTDGSPGTTALRSATSISASQGSKAQWPIESSPGRINSPARSRTASQIHCPARSERKNRRKAAQVSRKTSRAMRAALLLIAGLPPHGRSRKPGRQRAQSDLQQARDERSSRTGPLP